MRDYDYNYPPTGGNDPVEPEQIQNEIPAAQPVDGAYHMRGANEPQDAPYSGVHFNPAAQNPYQAPRQNEGYDPYNRQKPQEETYSPYREYYQAQQQEYYQSQNSGYEPPKTPKNRKKKKSHVGAIIAIAIVCVIVGALVGGCVMYLVGNNQNAVEAIPPIEESTLEIGGEAAASTDEEDTAFNSTTIEITTNSESTDMTPKDVYENYVNAVVAISNEGTATNIFGQVSATASSGSGMIISADGYILTNNHVVEGAEKLTVTMTNGEEYEATLIGADSDNDVALIKIEGEDFPTVSIGDSDNIQVGNQVCAIGNPLGELTNTLTVGYVSALDREINEDGIPINMFQTDCAINSGNSGGPIFDMNGNVIGITTAKYSSSSSYSASIEGIGFCIPINDAMSIVSDLLQYGYVKGRVSMGIMCQAISSTVTQYYNLPAGIYVSSVEPGSAAENAGIKEGDIICAIDGIEVASVTELKVKLKDYKPGDTATLTVYDNQTHETTDVDITFDEMVSSSTGEEEEDAQTGNESGQQIPDGYQINPYFPFG